MVAGILLAAVLLVVSSPSSAEDYPTEVNAAIADARKYCEDNGGKFAAMPSLVRKADLNGDRRDDYVIHLQEATCDGVGGAYCGTGGCELLLLVATPSGKFVSVFDDPVLSYEIL